MHAILATILLVASITAQPTRDDILHHLRGAGVPSNLQTYDLGPTIIAALTSYLTSLVANGFDPYIVEGTDDINIQLSDGSFVAQGTFENIIVEGISNVVINSISTPLIPIYMDFDVVLTQLQLSADSAALSIHFGNYDIDIVGSGGWVIIDNVQITGRATISILQLQVTNVNAVVTVGNIQAEAGGTVDGINGTTDLNSFLSNDLLNFLSTNSAEVNSVVGKFLVQLFNELL